MKQAERVSRSPAQASNQVAAPHQSLVEVLQEHYGLQEGQLPRFPRADWLSERKSGITDLAYWDWVLLMLQAHNMLPFETEFPPRAPIRVTLPDGANSHWHLENNLTDRRGEFNNVAAYTKPGLAVLQLDETLTERLRKQMYDELTFVVRKDAKFGLLYEVEYCSRESEFNFLGAESEESAELKPHAEVVEALLKGLRAAQQEFPNIAMCIPDADEIVWTRPAVWAFVPMDALNEAERAKLAGLLMSF